jgi:hypothetical protein
MRFYSYLFHGVLALFLLAVSLVPLFSGTHNLQLDMFPWQGRTMTYALMALAVAGLFTVFLAMTNRSQAPLFLWSILVLLWMLWGYFWRPYRWSGPDAFLNTLLLLAGAALAIFGAWFAMKRRPARR